VTDFSEAFKLDASPIDSDWDDMLAMLRDIKGYVAKTGDKVLPADDPGHHHDPPRVPRFGYWSMSGKGWTIKLSKAQSFDTGDDFSKVVRACLKSTDGRQKLVDFLNGGMAQLELPFKDS
jgi:hypothetical protein